MKYNLFLDDIRTPQMAYAIVKDIRYTSLDWVVVREYDDFVSYITEHGIPDLISFDHDLDISHYVDWSETIPTTDEKTGYDCAKWLVEYCMNNGCELPDYLTHTMNPVGKENIIGLFKSFARRDLYE
jgi:hypothetical protein